MDSNNRLVELFCDNGELEAPYLVGELIGKNYYRIKDIYWDMLSYGNPLGIGLDDIVEAQPNEDGDLSVTQIMTKSGYSTLRLMATARSAVVSSADGRGEDAIKFSDYLEKNGCTSMVSMASYWVVHIPPNFDSQMILDYIQAEVIPLKHYHI
jgi:Domain of unknown function (DUF4265)